MVFARGAANIAHQLIGWHPRGWGGGFLAHLHSPGGYDEPAILRYSIRQFGLTCADAGEYDRHPRFYVSHHPQKYETISPAIE
jgi:hypothetical protein